MDWEVVVVEVGGSWRQTTEMPAVPINHSELVIDSANVVWKKEEGKLEEINQGTPKTFQPSEF